MPDSLLAVARDFTPRVEQVDRNLVLLDLHGLGRIWPDPHILGQALLDSATRNDLEARVALAHSRSAASLIAREVPGVTVIQPGAEAAALAPLPLHALDADDDLLELLGRWGLATLGDLQRLPARGLAERLGPVGPRLRRLALGEDDRPLVPTPPAERFELALDLDWPVDGLEPLSFLLTRLLDPLCAQLLSRGRAAQALTLELRLVDRSRHVRRVAPAAPSAQARTWRTLLMLDLEAHPPRDAIQSILTRAEPTPVRQVQFSLLDPAQPAPEQLAETMARLTAWTEAGRAGSPRVLDTHRRDAFALGSFAPPPLDRRRARQAHEFATPGRLALRRFRPPLPAEVELAAGAPRFLAAACVRGPVLDRAGPWRASGDWWDSAWSRDEWDVVLARGVFRIYFDRMRKRWFVEGELD